MELRHLRYFVAVANELHFGRAAASLGIAQPPLSQQIKQLETEIGVELFDRSNRRVTLTDPGAIFLEEARQILRHVDKAVRATATSGLGESGKLAIGFVGSALAEVVPPIIRAFRHRYPGVRLELERSVTTSQVSALLNGQLHVGFARPPIRSDELEVVTVAKEQLMAAVPSDHPLALRNKISIRALADEPFVMLSRAQAVNMYDQIITLCQQSDFSPNIVQEAMPYQTITSLVAAGLGVSLVPSSIKKFAHHGVTFLPTREQPPDLKIVMMWRKSATLPPALRLFLDVAQQRVRFPRRS